ncbi:hypothetical protein [Saccharopolyspora hattusasensis]|uniref:hypothetical protein n=1 Tax=Saccharopolyspora hattusasensis TaxID=1128679 RepID=UPI003D999EB3
MATYVLVPGACHGGWWYEPLAAELREEGHAALPVTLPGLGPRDAPTGRPVSVFGPYGNQKHSRVLTREDSAWHVRSLPIGHNIVADAPDDFRKILLDAA